MHTVELTDEEMELLHNALQVYLDYEANLLRTIEELGVANVVIATRHSARDLRRRLVAVVGYDMT